MSEVHENDGSGNNNVKIRSFLCSFINLFVLSNCFVTKSLVTITVDSA